MLGPRPAGRLAHPAGSRCRRGPQGKGRGVARRRAPRRAREQARQCRPPSRCAATRSNSASAKAAIRKLALTEIPELSQPLGGSVARPGSARSTSSMPARPVPADRHRAGSGRAHPPIGRAVDPDHRAARQRARHRRAVDRSGRASTACWCRCRVCRIRAPEGIARQDRQAHLPDGRSVDDAGAGAAGQGAAGIRNSVGLQGREQAALSDRKARHGVGRRPDRRAAGLRPAHQRADRHLPLQHQRRAALRAGHAGECRAAVRDRARQRGDLGAGHPRADPRRLGPDFRQLHRPGSQRPRHPAARRRAAGAAHHHRGAHGRPRSRPGFDRQGHARGLDRLARW